MTFPIASRPTRAEISLENLKFNFHSIRDFVGETVKLMAVVKADAYGHGAVKCSLTLEAEGASWFGVATTEEAVEIREAGIKKPILSFGGYWPGQEQLLVEFDITPTIFDIEHARQLDRFAKITGSTRKIHIKIDTGMGRVGVPFASLYEFVDELTNLKQLEIEGLMTHFASADDLHDPLTSKQMRLFADAVSIFHEKGFRPTILDMANSPGTVGHSDSHGTMVRIGGILYGLGDDVLPKGIDRPELKPVLSLKSAIAFVKSVPAGTGIGYGQTFTTERESRIATIPIGYNDGYRRALSNRARVIINGSFAPVVGRVSMDWTTIDVTDIPEVTVGDEVILIGTDSNKTITAADLAAICDTISYEITCGIGKRVPRVFT